MTTGRSCRSAADPDVPGRNVVLLTASVMLAALTERHRFTIRGAPLDPARPLPGTLSPFRLRFEPLPRH